MKIVTPTRMSCIEVACAKQEHLTYFWDLSVLIHKSFGKCWCVAESGHHSIWRRISDFLCTCHIALVVNQTESNISQGSPPPHAQERGDGARPFLDPPQPDGGGGGQLEQPRGERGRVRLRHGAGTPHHGRRRGEIQSILDLIHALWFIGNTGNYNIFPLICEYRLRTCRNDPEFGYCLPLQKCYQLRSSKCQTK